MDATAFVYELASSVWGPHPMSWPTPPRRRPHWWQFKKRRHLDGLEYVFGSLNAAALDRYWSEVRKGQSVYEDAGGYMLRCYEAMLNCRVDEPYTHSQAASDLLAGGRL